MRGKQAVSLSNRPAGVPRVLALMELLEPALGSRNLGTTIEQDLGVQAKHRPSRNFLGFLF